MKINEIIKAKRQALQLTQEQVAQYLGVSTPAVNKWEKGNSYPDITLLPPLARLLKTDLNTLLSFEHDLSDQEVAMFLNELAECDNVRIAYDMAMDKINAFPNCMSLLYNSATILEYFAIEKKAKQAMEESFYQYIESLYQRVYEGTDEKWKSFAANMLIRKFIERKEYEKVEEIIKDSPDQVGISKQQMQIELENAYGHLEEAQRISEERLLNQANELYRDLLKLMELAIRQGRKEDGEAIAQKTSEFANLFDMWNYNCYVPQFEYYVKTKQKRKCIKVMIPMLKGVISPWNLNESPLYRKIKSKTMDPNFQKEMQNKLLHEVKESEETQFLQDELDDETLQQALR